MADTKIKSSNLADLGVTHDKLHTDMNLTSKTVQVATPTADSHPATKDYVDTEVAGVAGVSSFSYDAPTEVLTIATVDGGSFTADVSSLASESYVDSAVSNLIDSAPGALDTLNELAAAIGDDANFAATVTTNLSGKVDKINISGSTVGSSTQIPVITYNAQGQITGTSTTAVAGIDSVTFTNGVLTIAAGDGTDYTTDLDSRYFTETEASANFLGANAKAVDSDLLDGLNSTQFLRSDANDTATGQFTFTDGLGPAVSGLLGGGAVYISNSGASNNHSALQVNTTGGLGLAVQNSGRVGIGTSSPAHRFHINQPGNSPQLRISGYADWDFYAYNDSNFYINAASGTVLGLLGNRDAYFSENLGIGTASPSAKLDVRGQGIFHGSTGSHVGTNVGAITINSNVGDNTHAFSQGLAFTNNTSGAGPWTHAAITTEGSAGYRGDLVFGTDGDGSNNTTGITEKMRIMHNGNVGIGTTNPTSELHVHGRLSGGELGNTDIVRKDLHFYVDFNDKSCVSGTSATEAPLDLSPARYNLTLHGGANFEHKDGIGTYYFDGSDDYININDFVVADSSNTYEVWHYSNSQNGWETFWDSGNERPLLGVYANQLRAYPNGTTHATIDTGKWYHIVFAFASNSDLDVYVNGHRVTEAHNWGSAQRTGTFQFWLGGDGGQETTNGWIGVARAYTRQLTEQEVKQNYNAEVSRFATVTPSLGIVQSNGNVGIGATSINQKLTVNTPRRTDGGTNSLGAAVIAGPISVPDHDFTNSTAIFRVQGSDATNNIQFGVGDGSYSYHGWIQASYDNTSSYGAKDLLLQPIGGSVVINQTSPSYSSNDNTPVVGTTTANKLHINGSIQLLNNDDAIVFGRGTSSFMKDEEIGFGWGGGWYMNEGTLLRVRGNKHVHSTGPATFSTYYGDGSNLTGTGSSTTWGAVGTYAYAQTTDTVYSISAGSTTRSGSSIRPHAVTVYNTSASYTGNHHWPSPGTAPGSGTWQAMGGMGGAWGGGAKHTTTLWVRIA